MEVRKCRQLVQEVGLLKGSREIGDADGRDCGFKNTFF